MKKTLLLIDIQRDYFPGGRMELVGMNEASLQAGKLLSHFREKQWPVLHLQHISARKGAAFFLPDTEGVEIHQNVKPLAEEVVIEKHFPNGFRETGLLDELQKVGTEQLTICGAMSHLCIDATTRAAADHGFDCLLIHQACATRNLEFKGKTIQAENVHGSFMAALGMGYARVLNVEEFFKGK